MILPLISTYARTTFTEDERLSDIGLDALDLMSIANGLEIELGIEIRDAEVERWQFVSDIIKTAERLR